MRQLQVPTMVNTPEHSPAVAEILAERRPADTMAALVQSLHTSHNVMLAARMTPSGPAVSIAAVAEKTPNFAAAVDAVALSLTPAPASQIEHWLAELDALTIPRKGDAIDAGMRLAAYTKRLGEYPADVVRHVLLEQTWKFWPTWEELSVALDRWTAPRRAAVSHLRKANEATSRPQPAPFVPPSEEAKARAQDAVDALGEVIAERVPSEDREADERAQWRMARDRKSGRLVLGSGPSPELLKQLSGAPP